MLSFPKLLMVMGVVFVVVGVLWTMAGSLFPLGRLPGDITIEKGHFKFYFPLGASLLISAVLSFLFWAFHLWRR